MSEHTYMYIYVHMFMGKRFRVKFRVYMCCSIYIRANVFVVLIVIYDI